MFEFLDAIGAIMGSAGFGAITGGIFGWLNRREDRKAREKDQAHERSMISLRANAGEQLANANAFYESQKTKSAAGDFIRAIVRPVITACLMWLTFDIMTQIDALTGGLKEVLPPEMIVDMYRDIVLNIICLTTTAVSWWFASRGTAITNKK